MKIEFGDGNIEGAEIMVCCNRGIFSDDPNKVGAVFIFGGTGREVLSLVERALMLYAEYPEDCQVTSLSGGVSVEGEGSGRLDDVILMVAKKGGETLVVIDSGLDRAAIRDAFGRLKRYATRLTRMDVP